MKKGYVVAGILLVVAALAATALVYPSLPERVPTRWNMQGQVQHYGSKLQIFVMPGFMAGMLVLFFAVLPAVSPKRYEVESFRGTYDYLMFCVVALMGYLHGIILWSALHGPVNPGRGIVGGVCVFLILMGNVMGKVRRNFWIGVRTPWTLADERVWNATHRMSGWVFVVAGLAGLAAMLAGLNPVVSVAFFGAAAAVPVVYSLIYYKRLERRGEL
jgi:uncharacterized membrane protein